MNIERVAGITSAVGEGPIWDNSTNDLWFIDIVACRITRLESNGRSASWATPGRVGAIAAFGDGRVAVALESSFRIFDPAVGEFGPATHVDLGEGSVICEGKVDRQGRFVVMTSDSAFTDPIGEILRWEPDGSIARLATGYVLGNSLCWSVDGTTMYAADSIARVIHSYAYDPQPSSGLGRCNEFAAFAGSDPFPDGAVIDSEGHMLVVMHRSPHIARINPEGVIVDRITMPTPNITSLTFGGPDLDVLYVTSLDPTQVPVPPDAAALAAERGLLYRVTGTGLRGVPDSPVRVEPA